jgi:hypothetical protein
MKARLGVITDCEVQLENMDLVGNKGFPDCMKGKHKWHMWVSQSQ